MSFSNTTVSIGGSTKQSDYARLLANNVYNRSFKTIDSKSADYTILDTDTFAILYVTAGAANKTMTLPTASANTDRVIKIMKIDSGAGYCIVDGEGAETINGTTTWEITEQYGYIQIQCDGSQWFVIDRNDCCIYEVIDTSNYNSIGDSWTDLYSLAGLTAGIYEIYFAVSLRSNTSYAYATIASAVDTEDSPAYTIAEIGLTVHPASKLIKRAFTVATTLYLNAKTSTADAGGIWNQDATGNGIIRAKRIA